MRFDILTLFPDMFKGPLSESIIKRAVDNKIVSILVHNIRDYSLDLHKKVDDKPYGGGPGMLMQCQPIFDCIGKLKEEKYKKQKTIFLTPQGRKFTQKTAERLSKLDRLILLCGHYEGIDQRIRDNLIDEEISIGSYILTGGEIPAMVMIDSISRLIPGVLGKDVSSYEESFSKVLGYKKEYPQYTKPSNYNGYKVPDVLLSGDHKRISAWKKNNCK